MKITEVKKPEVVQVFFDETDFFLEFEERKNVVNIWLCHEDTRLKMPLSGISAKLHSMEEMIQQSTDIMYRENTKRSMEVFKKKYLDRIPYDKAEE